MMGIAAALVLATAGLSLVSWNRRGRRFRVGVVECLRVFLVTVAIALLWQPESTYREPPEEQPSVVLLVDESGSMTTGDVGESTRRGAAEQIRSDPTWQQLDDRFEWVTRSFGSKPGEGSDLAAAAESVAREQDQAAAVVLVSDGDWNRGGSPIEAVADLVAGDGNAARWITVPLGSAERLPDVELESADVPRFAVEGKPVRVPYSIRNWMPRTTELQAALKIGDEVAETQTIQLRSGQRFDGVMRWQAGEVGEYGVSVEVSPVEGEHTTLNNSKTSPIQVRQERLRVLVIESVPRWEYRYLRNALKRDPGIEVSCLLFHPQLEQLGGGGADYLETFPEDAESLADYHVVFLGDVGAMAGQLTAEQCRRLQGLVTQQASGLILMPGPRGNQRSLLDSELGSLYPVVLDDDQPKGIGALVPGQFALTRTGRNSLLTELNDDPEINWQIWGSLPGFYWHAPVSRIRAGSLTLAVHAETKNQYGRIPLLVTRTSGAGKVLFMGTDAVWRWRLGVEDKYHYRFWGQVIRWMAYQRDMVVGERMRLSYRPERPSPGERVSFRATVMTESGDPAEVDSVVLSLTSPGGDTRQLKLRSSGEGWGVYSGEMRVRESGEHALELKHPLDNTTVGATLSVKETAIELTGQPARPDVMRAIANVGGGRAFGSDQIEDVVSFLNQLPIPDAEIRRIQWWNHPAVLAALIGALAVFWVGRKWAGEI